MPASPRAQPAPPYKPTKRGGGGALKVLWWQGADAAAAALRQRHQGPGRLAHLLRAAGGLGRRRQPGAGPRRRDPDARERRPGRRRQVGHLEAEAGRHLARRQAVHRRRRASSPGNTRSDPATAAVTIGVYKDVKVEKVDSHTVKVTFEKPTPFWADAFVGRRGHDASRSTCSAPTSARKSRDAPTNLKPVGTGPYKFVDFKPGDMVRGEINTELPHAQPAATSTRSR